MRYILLLIFVFNSCRSTPEDCRKQLNEFPFKLSDIEIRTIAGLTIESSGVDQNGVFIIRGIFYNNLHGENLIVPHISLVKGTKISRLDSLIFEKMAILEASSINTEIERMQESIELFQKLKVYRLDSQKHLGSYIRFDLYPGCTIWYTRDKSELSPKFRKVFHEKNEFKSNWYIEKD